MYVCTHCFTHCFVSLLSLQSKIWANSKFLKYQFVPVFELPNNVRRFYYTHSQRDNIHLIFLLTKDQLADWKLRKEEGCLWNCIHYNRSYNMVYDCFILIKRRKMTGETHPRRIHTSPTLYIYYCHCLFKCDCLLSMLETWHISLALHIKASLNNDIASACSFRIT